MVDPTKDARSRRQYLRYLTVGGASLIAGCGSSQTTPTASESRTDVSTTDESSTVDEFDSSNLASIITFPSLTNEEGNPIEINEDTTVYNGRDTLSTEDYDDADLILLPDYSYPEDANSVSGGDLVLTYIPFNVRMKLFESNESIQKATVLINSFIPRGARDSDWRSESYLFEFNREELIDGVHRSSREIEYTGGADRVLERPGLDLRFDYNAPVSDSTIVLPARITVQIDLFGEDGESLLDDPFKKTIHGVIPNPWTDYAANMIDLTHKVWKAGRTPLSTKWYGRTKLYTSMQSGFFSDPLVNSAYRNDTVAFKEPLSPEPGSYAGYTGFVGEAGVAGVVQPEESTRSLDGYHTKGYDLARSYHSSTEKITSGQNPPSEVFRTTHQSARYSDFKNNVEPLVDNGKIIVARAESAFEGTIAAVDTHSGEDIWSEDAGSMLASTPTIHDGNVIFGTAGNQIRSHSLLDGSHNWSYDLESAVLSPVLVQDSTVIVLSGQLIGIDAETGERTWSTNLGANPFDSRVYRPIISGDSIYTTVRDNILEVDIQDGEIINEITIPERHLPSGGMVKKGQYSVVPVTEGPADVWQEQDDKPAGVAVYGEGGLNWERPKLAEGANVDIAAVDKESVYVSVDGDRFHSLSLSSGETRWSLDESFTAVVAGSGDSRQVICTRNRNDGSLVRGYSPTGELLWSETYTFSIASPPVVVDNHIILKDDSNNAILLNI